MPESGFVPEHRPRTQVPELWGKDADCLLCRKRTEGRYLENLTALWALDRKATARAAEPELDLLEGDYF